MAAILGSLIENIYQDAVTACLDESFDTCERAGDDVLEEFRMLGVQPLRKLGSSG